MREMVGHEMQTSERLDRGSPRLLTERGAFLAGSALLRPAVLAVALTGAALVYWLWFALSQRSIVGDDGVSILAAKGILEHGYPLLPSGYVYARDYLPHYVLAGVMGILGTNGLSVVLPSIAFAAGSLWLTYLIGSRVMGRAWVGLAAVAILVALQAQTLYATSPRMYMTLQFFSMLAVYSAWRGYAEESVKYRAVATLALVGAILSHGEGVVLVLAIATAIAAVLLVKRQMPAIRPVEVPLYAAPVGLALWLALIFRPAEAMPAIVDHGGLDPEHVRLALIAPIRWGRHLISLETVFPHGMVLMPVATAGAFLALVSTRWADPNRGVGYALVVLGVSAALLMVVMSSNGVRFWLFVLPLYVLLACVGVEVLVRSWRAERHGLSSGDRWLALSLLAAGALINLAFITGIWLARDTGFADMTRNGYGLPCRDDYYLCSRDIKGQYDMVRTELAPQDLVISTNPWVTHHYLGRVDGFLRERRLPDGAFTTFSAERDEFFGVPLVDSVGELDALFNGPQRVWIIVDQKADWAISSEVRSLVEQQHQAYHRNALMTTFVSRAASDGL